MQAPRMPSQDTAIANAIFQPRVVLRSATVATALVTVVKSFPPTTNGSRSRGSSEVLSMSTSLSAICVMINLSHGFRLRHIDRCRVFTATGLTTGISQLRQVARARPRVQFAQHVVGTRVLLQ